MSIEYKVYDFPLEAIQDQVFYAGGAAYEGGFTSGGARIISPEPGGRATLELQPSLQVNEWDFPFVSWLMTTASNGALFRVPLTKTPQLISDTAFVGIIGSELEWEQDGLYPSSDWDNGQPWASDGIVFASTFEALEGSTVVKVDTTSIGPVIKAGHVLGVGDHSYMVQEISYDDNNIATMLFNPPLRDNLSSGDYVYARPYFLGTVTNITELRSTYSRANNGNIQPGRIVFMEALI